MRAIVILTLILSLTIAAAAQDLSTRSLQKLLDCPIAGGPEARSYEFELRAFPAGGVLAGFTVGLIKRFQIGVSYGGTDVIGYNKPEWNPAPGVSAQFRLLNESTALPALAFGFVNQGYGGWDADKNRYQYKAKGFYAALGKYFQVMNLGDVGFHSGVNQNALTGKDQRLDFWLASDYHLTEQVAVIAEYSAAINDQGQEQSFSEGHGYLNAAVRWSFGQRLAIDLILRDLLVNLNDQSRGGKQLGRELRMCYVENF